MFELKNVELSDKARAEELLALSDFRGCEYSFGNNYMWSEVFNIKIAFYKNRYIAANKFGFLFPAGEGDVREIVEVLREYSANNGKKLLFSSMNKAAMETLKEMYAGEIEIATDRDYYDYIYETEALASLSGKKLHAKRNHLNRFYENNWGFEPITAANLPECISMHDKWCVEHDCLSDPEKRRESEAVKRGLASFFELGFVGGLIRVDGLIRAYTFGEKLNSDTFVVHVEKAFTEFQGTYTAINREFVNYACGGYKYVNREEDMGEQNLRKAKTSYHPAFLEEKYRVRFVN